VISGHAGELAQQLEQAWQQRTPIAPLSESAGLSDVGDAYAVQTAWTAHRLQHGEEIAGWKIGLTSAAVQEQMGVHEPDFGTLWGSRRVALEGGRGEVAAETFLQPRVEGELAFLIGEPPQGPNLTAADVVAATEAVAASIEIVDSRIQDWRITLADTIADNASYGGFAVGPWTELRPERRLDELAMTVTRGGETVASGSGAAALGDPANAVAWLLNKLSSLDVQVRPGDVILSGAWAATVPILAGDEFRLEIEGEPPVEVAFR
jgi:2-keto-4-pentenoate hydratase